MIDFDASNRRITGPEGTVRITQTQANILAVLTQLSDWVSSRTLAAAVWGQDADPVKRFLRVYIHQLRRALLKAGCPVAIVSEYQRGYRLEVAA